MLVDDEPDITEIIKMGLQKKGFEIDTFNEPAKASVQYRPDYYDLVITDVRMPGMTGFDLAKRVWAIDQNARICFMTAFEIYEYEAKKVFTNFKTYCFIKKPISIDSLAKHIEAHFARAG